MSEKNINFIEGFYKIFLTVMLAIIGFFCAQTYQKIIELEKDIINIRLKVTAIESQALNEEKVKSICVTEIYKFHGEKTR